MPRKNLQQARALSNESEEYAQLYFKYSVIIEDQIYVVRHMSDMTKEVDEAYAKVCGEHNNGSRGSCTRWEFFDTSKETKNWLTGNILFFWQMAKFSF